MFSGPVSLRMSEASKAPVVEPSGRKERGEPVRSLARGLLVRARQRGGMAAWEGRRGVGVGGAPPRQMGACR